MQAQPPDRETHKKVVVLLNLTNPSGYFRDVPDFDTAAIADEAGVNVRDTHLVLRRLHKHQLAELAVTDDGFAWTASRTLRFANAFDVDGVRH